MIRDAARERGGTGALLNPLFQRALNVGKEVLSANGMTEAYMRPVAWLGSEKMGVSPTGAKPHLAIAAWEWGKYYPPEKAEKGIRLTIAPWRRPAPYTAPTESKALHDLHDVEEACGKWRL